MEKQPEKKCGAGRCRRLATHVAADGAYTFYLCAEHAKTATCSPLNAKTVMPLAPPSPERLTAAQYAFLHQANAMGSMGVFAVGTYRPAQHLLKIGFVAFKTKPARLSTSESNRYLITDAGKHWLKKHDKEPTFAVPKGAVIESYGTRCELPPGSYTTRELVKIIPNAVYIDDHTISLKQPKGPKSGT